MLGHEEIGIRVQLVGTHEGLQENEHGSCQTFMAFFILQLLFHSLESTREIKLFFCKMEAFQGDCANNQYLCRGLYHIQRKGVSR